MRPSKDYLEARSAARLAIGTYARYPSDANARQVETAVRRLREIAQAVTRRRMQRARRRRSAGG